MVRQTEEEKKGERHVVHKVEVCQQKMTIWRNEKKKTEEEEEVECWEHCQSKLGSGKRRKTNGQRVGVIQVRYHQKIPTSLI